MTLFFTLTPDASNRTVSDWHKAGPNSAEANARRYARQHGAAGLWRADDSLLVFWVEADKLRRKTYRDACPAPSTAGTGKMICQFCGRGIGDDPSDPGCCSETWGRAAVPA